MPTVCRHGTQSKILQQLHLPQCPAKLHRPDGGSHCHGQRRHLHLRVGAQSEGLCVGPVGQGESVGEGYPTPPAPQVSEGKRLAMPLAMPLMPNIIPCYECGSLWHSPCGNKQAGRAWAGACVLPAAMPQPAPASAFPTSRYGCSFVCRCMDHQPQGPTAFLVSPHTYLSPSLSPCQPTCSSCAGSSVSQTS